MCKVIHKTSLLCVKSKDKPLGNNQWRMEQSDRKCSEVECSKVINAPMAGVTSLVQKATFTGRVVE